MSETLALLLQSDGINPLASTRVILALVCVVVASSLALGVAVGLSRRIQMIADQRPVPSKHEEGATSPPHQPELSDDASID